MSLLETHYYNNSGSNREERIKNILLRHGALSRSQLSNFTRGITRQALIEILNTMEANGKIFIYLAEPVRKSGPKKIMIEINTTQNITK